MSLRSLFVILLALLLLAPGKSVGRHIKKRKIKKLFRHSVILNDHFTGFALYDLDQQKMVYELNDSNYFTPASNTKLFTYYAAVKMLGDSIPALKYVIHNDSLIFWGVGDPAFLNSSLGEVKGFNFLRDSHKKLFYAAGNYTGNRYGYGWAWDDYNDDYQAEISAFPIENNLALFYTGENKQLKVRPAYLNQFVQSDSTYKPDHFMVKRDFLSNRFVYPAGAVPANFKQQVPWQTSDALMLAILQDTLKQSIGEVHWQLPSDAKTIYDINADTVYRHMLQSSDNFIAEQLLLVCSSARFSVLNTDSAINYATSHFLIDLPDKPQWVDGSGLSRQNLFTPRDMVKLLCKILDDVKDENLVHSLLPAGGVAGTIKNSYKLDNGKPFVWAKTGSLNNNYNQTGYLLTKKGKRLAFSFMNNNFTRPTREVRAEMAKVITAIHDDN